MANDSYNYTFTGGFSEGYRDFATFYGNAAGVDSGGTYVHQVEDALDILKKDLLQFEGNRKKANILGGDVAEFWLGDSFNIDAVVKDVKDRANVIRSNELGSPDIVLNDGRKMSLKYYADAAKSVKAQSKTLQERYDQYAKGVRKKGKEPLSMKEYLEKNGRSESDIYLYAGQQRIIPSDQMASARTWLKDKIANLDPKEAEPYKDAYKMIDEKIRGANGAESATLTKNESTKLAELAQKASDTEIGAFLKEKGLITEELIKVDYVLAQALKAARTAAAISIVLKVAPEICNMLLKLIKKQGVAAGDFKSLGFAALGGGADGFVSGYISAGITVACRSGAFGIILKTLEPSVIGAVVALTLSSIKDGIQMALGNCDKKQFIDNCLRNLIVASASVGLGIAGGAIGVAAAASLGSVILASLGSVLPVIGTMIGGFVGSVIGTLTYKAVNSCTLALAVEHGFTFFGLVEQDYTLPESVLKEIGVEVFEYEKFSYKRFEYKHFQYKRFEYKHFEPKQITFTFLSRGVIGAHVVGYV